MSAQAIFWTILALAVLLFLPAALLWSMAQHLRGKGSERPGSGGISAGVGAAMQELDRIMARPSVEHQTKTENQTLKRDDDSDGA